MSEKSALVDDTRPVSSRMSDGESAPPQSSVLPNDYTELIQRLFHNISVVAIIGCGSGLGTPGICREISSELARAGRRVVLVSVHALLRSSPIMLPDQTAFIPGPVRGVWLWPSSVGQQIQFFKSRTPSVPENWLESLRRNFDSVLLDCPALGTEPGGAVIGAMADAAVLAIDVGHTPKSQILREQRALQLSGVRLAGCIVIKPN